MAPMIDISAVLTNPRMVDRFSVIRQQESIGSNGRASITPQTFFPVYGTVMAGQPNKLEMNDADTRTTKTLSIVTRFRLQGTSPNREADVVVWPYPNGDSFKVTAVDDYSQYASGFVQATAESTDAQDYPPAGPAAPAPLLPGQLLPAHVQTGFAFVDQEFLTPTADPLVWMLAGSPNPPESVHMLVDKVPAYYGTDFMVNGMVVTFSSPVAPSSVVDVNYRVAI